MLKRITMTHTHNEVLKAGLSIKFKRGVNFLVGEQGSGKSSLLNLIIASGRGRDQGMATFETEPSYMLSLDFEKGNPRMGKREIEDINDVIVMFKSHGEVVKAQIRGLIGQLKERTDQSTICVLDEPDTGLSVRSCEYLLNTFDEAIKLKRGNQIIAAVHNPIVILGQEEVYSLDEFRWMPSEEYLQSHGFNLIANLRQEVRDLEEQIDANCAECPGCSEAAGNSVRHLHPLCRKASTL